jgi:hypothetical protein
MGRRRRERVGARKVLEKGVGRAWEGGVEGLEG